MLRNRSIIGIDIWHITVLGFVNAFGYWLPTLHMLKKGKMNVFEYLFQSFYLDLVFTIVFSLVFLRRAELHTFKLLKPIAIAIFGIGFHNTAYMKNLGGSVLILNIEFSPIIPTLTNLIKITPEYSTNYFYIFLISRLSKCFVSVASKAFLLKEQAYRKTYKAYKNSLRKKIEIESGSLTKKSFITVNKKSLLYKRALHQAEFDKMLREEE